MSETGSVLKGDPRIEKQRWSRRLSLTSRILFVNVLPLVLLGGGVIYVDAYRKQLLDERFKLALVEAQIGRHKDPQPHDPPRSCGLQTCRIVVRGKGRLHPYFDPCNKLA